MWKKLLFGLLGLVALLLLIGFLLPGKMEVSRSLSVNAPPEYSFEEVNTLPNWEKWSYWNTLDPNMKVTYGEKTIGEGGYYSWDSEDMGPGKCTITESIPNSSVKIDLDFLEQGTAKGWYTFEPLGDSTKVTMGFSTEFGMNPVMRWVGFAMMESEMNKAFDYNLQKLKELAEAKPKFAVKITEDEITPVSYIGISHTMSPKDMKAVSVQMSKMYDELMTVLEKSKIQMNGHAFCIYPSYSPESMNMVCALPVSPDAKLPSKYKLQQTPGGKAVKVIHTGSYDGLETAHNEIAKYMEFKKIEMNGAPWEVYVTGPDTEPDASKWVTEIYYPVK
jgi:effector-binding domain-containing protein